jgi:hypothetical protein
MKISINDHRKVFAIQEEFSAAFSNLKLEFHAKPHQSAGSADNEYCKHSAHLSECRTIHESGEITMTPHMTVANLEQNFRDVYGLGVEVFKKSGTNWVSTADLTGLTLEELNK